MKKKIAIFAAAFIFLTACGMNSVTKEEIGAIKPGDVIYYRFQKNGKSWFYADKITRIEGEKVYYNPGKMEANKGTDESLKDFDSTRELSIEKSELAKFAAEQGDDKKVIIWIK
ncbi:MAG: hypothetical protein KIS76_03110 [Pyrinomonadaceae bacterium]|nr:hypothetical protein [Pyrinomonadaceae bacterium]